jgi:hypothetical protein
MSLLSSPTDYSFRKLNRKIAADGFKKAIIAVPELLVRKSLGKPIYQLLVDRGVIKTISRDDLSHIASKMYSVDSEMATEPITSIPFISLLDSGYVFPTSGLTTTLDVELIEESVTSPQNSDQIVTASLVRHLFIDDVRLGLNIIRGDPKHIGTRATERRMMSPLCPRFLNYYHWMIETVPRVRYLQAYEEQTGTDVSLLVPSEAPPWLSETLQLLGWPESKVERAKSPAYRVNDLILPSFPGLLPQDYQWMRRKILQNPKPEHTSVEIGSNVYISRADAIERQIINEREVMDMLSEYGFKCYRLEESSVLENAYLFNNADLVIGAHGAGLTDLIFCTEGTILELFGSKIKPPYKRLADAVGVKYDSMICKPKSTDIEVDIEKLEKRVQKILD